MGILNPLDVVWQRFLAFITVFLVLLWVYKNMQDTPFKRWVSENVEKIKEAIKGGE